MDDSGGSRGILLQSENMGHHIMTSDLFLRLGDFEGLVGHDEVGPDGLDGFVGDLGETQLLLGFGEPEPEFSPC